MYENYCTTLGVEVETLIGMVETGILPACTKDMANYAACPELAGERKAVYIGIKAQKDKLKKLFGSRPHDLPKEALYLCDVVKPQMDVVRKLVDQAEGLLQKGLYPYPTYAELIYSHHY
uniref:Uncharacterized protein n=1 Tax=Zooxanthella nutricula TaxID=1333877 RepID=A0A7S2VPI7_9DINO|mmetsp:Transcript_90147/g.276077  ORF Transcript_90147/g.276077 Transcript_90147/m.276077 type:complete len:119 (+) Transcript_90147:1-357(+)